MKKTGKRLLLILLVLALVWGCVVGVDYWRARAQQKPFFTVQTAHVLDGGTVVYYGIGYTVVDFNQMPDNGGRTDTVFYFSPPSSILLSAIVQFLVLFFLPILVCFLFYRYIPRLLFLSPLLTVSLIFLTAYVTYGPPTLSNDLSAWVEFFVFILYHLLVCTIFRVYGHRKKRKNGG